MPKTSDTRKILTSFASTPSGPGWTNTPIIVVTYELGMRDIELKFIQPKNQTDVMSSLHPIAAEMNEEMIDAWNNAVLPKDEVWIGGDFAYNAKDEGSISVGKLFMALNGKKHLVRGNHDEQNRSVLQLPWTTVTDLATVKCEGMRFVMCHYPLETWKSPSKYIHLHGHCHGNLKRLISRRFDVGVDVGEPVEADFLYSYGQEPLRTFLTHNKTYAPVPLERYWQIGNDQKFQAQDHHG